MNRVCRAERVTEGPDGYLVVHARQHGFRSGDHVFVGSPLGILPGGIKSDKIYRVESSGESLTLSEDGGLTWIKYVSPGSEVYLAAAEGVTTVLFGHSTRPGQSGFGLIEGGETWTEQQKRDGQRLAEVTGSTRLQSTSAQYRLLFSLWDSVVLVSYQAVEGSGRAGAYAARIQQCREAMGSSGCLNVDDLIAGRWSARSRSRGLEALSRSLSVVSRSKATEAWIYEAIGAGAGSGDRDAVFGFGLEGWSFADHVEALAAIVPWPLCRRIEVVSSDIPAKAVGDYLRFSTAQQPPSRPHREGIQQITRELVAALQGDLSDLDSALRVVASGVQSDSSLEQQLGMLFYGVRLTCGRASAAEDFQEGIVDLLASNSMPEEFVRSVAVTAVERLIGVGGSDLLDSLVELCDSFLSAAHHQHMGAFVVEHLVSGMLNHDLAIDPRLKHLQMLSRMNSASASVSGGRDALRSLLLKLFDSRADVRDGTFHEWVAAMSGARVCEQRSELASQLFLKFWTDYDDSSSPVALFSRWRLRRSRKRFGRLLGAAEWGARDVVAAARVGERVLRVAWRGAKRRTHVGQVLAEAYDLPASSQRSVCHRLVATCVPRGSFKVKQFEVLLMLGLDSPFFQSCLKLLYEQFERLQDRDSAGVIESRMATDPKLKRVFDNLGLRESATWDLPERGYRRILIILVAFVLLLGAGAVLTYWFFPMEWSALETAWNDQVRPRMASFVERLMYFFGAY